MSLVRVDTILPPDDLKEDVECLRVFAYAGEDALSIKISPIAVPGIVFQHKNGQSIIESISVPSKIISSLPTSFVYGPGTKPSIMKYKKGPFATIQVILKPHALRTLFGINAETLTDGIVELDTLAGYDINEQLLAGSEQQCVTLLTNFLLAQHKKFVERDIVVEECLDLINQNINTITIKYLLEQLHLSERQFEKRFLQSVGISPQVYIRVKRFNEAIRLMKTKKYERLTDVAHALHFYDQSHFIRDLKEFSGITPSSISEKVENFHDQGGFSYV